MRDKETKTNETKRQDEKQTERDRLRDLGKEKERKGGIERECWREGEGV